jgi:hypothetical protein
MESVWRAIQMVEVAMASRLKYGIFAGFKSLWRGYEYLYYRLYSWNLRTWGEGDLPQYNAMFGVTFMSFLNTVTLVVTVGALANIQAVFEAKEYQIAAIVIILAVINYYALVHDGKYKSIAATFSKEKSSARTKNAIFCWLYVILSFAFAILLAWYARKSLH